MPPSEVPNVLPAGPFTGPVDFAQMIRDALASAASEGWSEMVWSDANFEDWPLRERAVVESLHGWAKRGRRLVMLASTYESVQRHQARFVEWRGLWGHIIECRVARPFGGGELPSVLWSPHWFIRRLDLVRSSGVSSFEAPRRVLLREELDEWIKQSAPGFPATVLGL
jgi:hypothetical protein